MAAVVVGLGLQGHARFFFLYSHDMLGTVVWRSNVLRGVVAVTSAAAAV
jgi:hypothetical protein